jgi:hypothetical protein
MLAFGRRFSSRLALRSVKPAGNGPADALKLLRLKAVIKLAVSAPCRTTISKRPPAMASGLRDQINTFVKKISPVAHD